MKQNISQIKNFVTINKFFFFGKFIDFHISEY